MEFWKIWSRSWCRLGESGRQEGDLYLVPVVEVECLPLPPGETIVD
jgi:hypothetical protein